MNNKIILECNALQKTFADGKLYVKVLRGIDLTICRGELVALIGVSGSGKSTLLHILGGLDKPTAGRVLVDGQDIAKLSEQKRSDLRNKKLGFIYQFHHLLPEFSALENVAMPLLIRGDTPKSVKPKVLEILELVGLQERIQHRIGELSGGERQRVAIARALITKPLCVLADEPTGNLDHKTAEQIFELIMQLNRELKIAFLFATHDLSLANRAGRVLKLEDGICESNKPDNSQNEFAKNR